MAFDLVSFLSGQFGRAGNRAGFFSALRLSGSLILVAYSEIIIKILPCPFTGNNYHLGRIGKIHPKAVLLF
jgi:hypothetical protein